MKKPDNYDLKKWLCKNRIIGLEVNYQQTGIDEAETYWILKTKKGEIIPVRRYDFEKFVDVIFDHCSVMRAKKEVIKEVKEWDEFVRKEKRDLSEYERLKKKFEQ